MLICCQRSDGNAWVVEAPATITRPSAGESTAVSGAEIGRSGSRKKNRKNVVSTSRTMPTAGVTSQSVTIARRRPPMTKGQPAGSMRMSDTSSVPAPPSPWVPDGFGATGSALEGTPLRRSGRRRNAVTAFLPTRKNPATRRATEPARTRVRSVPSDLSARVSIS